MAFAKDVLHSLFLNAELAFAINGEKAAIGVLKSGLDKNRVPKLTSSKRKTLMRLMSMRNPMEHIALARESIRLEYRDMVRDEVNAMALEYGSGDWPPMTIDIEEEGQIIGLSYDCRKNICKAKWPDNKVYEGKLGLMQFADLLAGDADLLPRPPRNVKC